MGIPAKDDSEDEGDELVDLSNSENDLLAKLLAPLIEKVSKLVSLLHLSNMIHGDITTSNILCNLPTFPNTEKLTTINSVHEFLANIDLYFIDFGLSKTNEHKSEERSVDLYVLERAWISTHPTTANCLALLWKKYFEAMGDQGVEIENKLKKVRL